MVYDSPQFRDDEHADKQSDKQSASTTLRPAATKGSAR
eukprot:gene1826-21481_t